MGISEIFLWWNLPFVLPFALALVLTLLQAVGALHIGHFHVGHIGEHGGHHIHLGHHVGHDVGHHLHSGGHAVAHAHASGSHDHNHAVHTDHDHDSFRPLAKFMGLLGVGKVPITVVIPSFLLIFGIAGMVSNKVLGGILLEPTIFFGLSFGIAFISSAFCTGIMSQFIGKLMPSDQSYGATNNQLVGRYAQTIIAITDVSGAAATTDDFKCRVEVACRVAVGEPNIPRNSKVLISEYNDVLKYFIVRPDPLGALEGSLPSSSDLKRIEGEK